MVIQLSVHGEMIQMTCMNYGEATKDTNVFTRKKIYPLRTKRKRKQQMMEERRYYMAKALPY